jgi:uncharacterized protein YbbC (DUF1343 family)
LPIYSLYGPHAAPPAEALADLAALLIDLQDVGCRWYTFVATLQAALRACKQASVPALLLDRPNPQGGVIVEGMYARPAHFSLVAPAAIPPRYGLTFGELARWLNEDIGAELDVILMRGYQREMLWAETGLLWAAPSPAMPHPRTALCYSGTCLLEGLNVSEGRGTALPFEQIGAPYITPEALIAALEPLNLHSVVFHPAWFRPQTGKFAGEDCGGVRLHITETQTFQGFAVGLHLVNALRRLHPDEATWLESDGQYVFDRLLASAQIREQLDDGGTVEEILEACAFEAQEFQNTSSAVWLYD